MENKSDKERLLSLIESEILKKNINTVRIDINKTTLWCESTH